MTIMTEFKEESYVIVGLRKLRLGLLCSKAVGEYDSVSPDVMFIIKNLKWVLGTYHTHPGVPLPSSMDIAAWGEETKMYAPPIYFVIEGNRQLSCFKWIGGRDLHSLRKARMVKLWKIVWFY